MTRRNIFIDLDGTLIDIAPRHHRVYTFCVNQFGGQALCLGDYWRLKRQDAPWREVLRRSNIDVANEAKFLQCFVKHIELLEELFQDKLFSESEEILRYLSKHNNLYLLSLRRDSEALEQQINHLGIRRYFLQILSGHSDTKAGTLTKKAEVIQQTGAELASVVVIGDTEADIAAAQQLGVVSVALASGIRNEKFLENMKPTHILSGIGDIKKLQF